ncbi:LOW QUALITY PROTEIN: interleukin-17 receptor B [Theristicus caerulescens]
MGICYQPVLIPGYISSQGSAPELRKWYKIAPADLHNLSAVLVEKEVETQFQSYFMNISTSTDGRFVVRVAGGDPKENRKINCRGQATIKELTATKIYVTSKGILEHFQCILCNYTEKSERQAAVRNQRWQFHYIGFPVELETKYFIHAYNLPLANIKEDFPSKSILLTIQGNLPSIHCCCKDNVMKYSKSCIEMGSLWNPSITCKIEIELEVNFATSSLGLEYLILLYECQKYEVLLEKKRGSKGNFLLNHNKLKAYFSEFSFCIKILTINSVGRFVCVLLAALLAIVQLQLHVKVLVIYPEVCFHHTVFSCDEPLHEGCQTDVILDMWEKMRIAEKGSVQWLAAKAAADRMIFLSSNPATAACDVSCKSMRNHNNMENTFTFAVNLFCSDMTNQSSLRKYMVVSFNEVSKDTLPSALNFCPKYGLMKDICRDLSVSCDDVHGKK